jgi:hypothetical protein
MMTDASETAGFALRAACSATAEATRKTEIAVRVSVEFLTHVAIDDAIRHVIVPHSTAVTDALNVAIRAGSGSLRSK